MVRTGVASIDILVRSALWDAQPGAAATVRDAIATAAGSVCGVAATTAEVSVVLTDDAAIRKLNRDWRGRDEPTNVLAFPARPAAPGALGEGGRSNAAPVVFGDIVISYETTARQAGLEGRPFAHHLAHLAVHGFLHLLGYDHDSHEDADAMERLEAEILARLDVPDPYLTRPHEA